MEMNSPCEEKHGHTADVESSACDDATMSTRRDHVTPCVSAVINAEVCQSCDRVHSRLYESTFPSPVTQGKLFSCNTTCDHRVTSDERLDSLMLCHAVFLSVNTPKLHKMVCASV